MKLITIGILIALIVLISSCSSEKACRDYKTEECPEKCVICPPCNVCSSVSCQSEDFCNAIGFDREWERQTGQRPD